MPSSFMAATLSPRALALLRVYGPLELLLVHPRAPVDAELLRLVVQLVARAPLGAVRARALAAALAGRLVLDRGPRARSRLAVPCALLVDGARGDLLRPLRRCALLLLARDDVLVLPFPLRAFLQSAWWHRSSSSWMIDRYGLPVPDASPISQVLLLLT